VNFPERALQDENCDGLAMSSGEVRRVLLRFPRLPSYNLKETIRPRIEILRSKLGLGFWDIEKPTFYDADALACGSANEGEISSVVAFLQSAQEEDDGADVKASSMMRRGSFFELPPGRRLAGILCMAPQVLGVRLGEKFDALKVKRDTLPFSKRFSACRLSCLSWFLTTRCDNADRLQDLGFKRDVLAQCVIGLPTILTYSTEKNLKPKVGSPWQSQLNIWP